MTHEGHWNHLRRNAWVVHKTVGMSGRQFRHLPRHSAFGFRRSDDAGGGAISLFSRVQKVNTAASFESEYVALAEVVNELRFLRHVKGFLTTPIDDNIVIREDTDTQRSVSGGVMMLGGARSVGSRGFRRRPRPRHWNQSMWRWQKL